MNIWGRDKELILKPSGVIARVDFNKVHDVILEIEGGVDITVVRRQFGKLFIPPDLEKLGTHFIVSSLVLEAMRHFRKMTTFNNFFCPDTGPSALRDSKGSIEAVVRLIAL